MQDQGLSVIEHFSLEGKFVSLRPFGEGHIHDTYLARYDVFAAPRRYILQRLNLHVFGNPEILMDNIIRVTTHIRTKLKTLNIPDADRRTLTLAPTKEGGLYYKSPQGDVWRMFVFIEQGRTYNVFSSFRLAFEAARAFGEFQKWLSDLPPPRLHETIPDFHNTKKRFQAFEEAVEKDPHGRTRDARPEIEFALEHRDIAPVLVDLAERGDIPERITHNDTKLDNIIFDEKTGEALCVIDLDTVMPGLIHYDFGDMVRSLCCPAPEDEQDQSKVFLDLSVFEKLAQGYLYSLNDVLTRTEKDYLAFAGKLICFEQGIRFLTDFLLGDMYYKTKDDWQNLRRCRTQFKLVESILLLEDKMNDIIRKNE